VWKVSDDPFDGDLYRWLLPAGAAPTPPMRPALPQRQDLPAPLLNPPPVPPADLSRVDKTGLLPVPMQSSR
jgi:hypothetical protein